MNKQNPNNSQENESRSKTPGKDNFSEKKLSKSSSGSQIYKQNPIKEVNELKEEIETLENDGTNWYKGWDRLICKKDIRLVKETKLQTLQKANKQFAEVLGEEIVNLEDRRKLNDTRKIVFNECVVNPDENVLTAKEMINFENKWLDEQISHLKQLKKEYEESLK